VVKIRQQLQTHHVRDAALVSGPTYGGIISTLRTIVREEGLSALWKGNVSAALLYVTFGATQFAVYQRVQEYLDAHKEFLPQTTHSFVAGACAGGVATAASYPLDTLRTRFAAQGTGQHRVYTSLAQAVHHMYAREGTRGFFRGLASALTQIVPNMSVFFGAYALLHDAYDRYAPTAAAGWSPAVAGGAAGITAKTAVFPLDLVRKRLQVQGVTRTRYVHHNIPIYEGTLRALRDIVRSEGFLGLYKGLPVSLLKAAPNSGITMFVYSSTLVLLEKWNQ
jgi:solute carrier family 25 thiamine pyrophosphate transporter 19